MSNYEMYIMNVLIRGRVPFEREKTFEDLRKGKYRYDFYLPQYKGRRVLIEVDGEQHFKQIKHFQKNRTDFKKAQEHDRRKNSYALSHDILLVRIPFWEISTIYNVEDLFQDKFIVKNKYHNDNIKAPSIK